MGYWNGHLLNTPANILTDTVLVLLTIWAYVPQINQLQHAKNAQGISSYYVLFDVWFSNAQLSEALLLAAYAWPTDRRPLLKQLHTGDLRGLEALGGMMGVLQIAVQWACSIAVLLSYAYVAGAERWSTWLISITAFLHAVIVLLPFFNIAIPQSRGVQGDVGTGVIIGLATFANMAVAPCFVLLQFVAQFCDMWYQHGQPGALSLDSLKLQAAWILAVSIRWFLRLGRPNWEPYDRRTPLWEVLCLWYTWAFPCVNYLVHASGCAILVMLYRRALPEGDQAGSYGLEKTEYQVPFK